VRPKVGKNRLHFDLAPVGGDQHGEVDRLITVGATRLDAGPGGSVAMTDPDGNEFCLLAPG
jgi:hypothetical protein